MENVKLSKETLMVDALTVPSCLVSQVLQSDLKDDLQNTGLVPKKYQLGGRYPIIPVDFTDEKTREIKKVIPILPEAVPFIKEFLVETDGYHGDLDCLRETEKENVRETEKEEHATTGHYTGTLTKFDLPEMDEAKSYSRMYIPKHLQKLLVEAQVKLERVLINASTDLYEEEEAVLDRNIHIERLLKDTLGGQPKRMETLTTRDLLKKSNYNLFRSFKNIGLTNSPIEKVGNSNNNHSHNKNNINNNNNNNNNNSNNNDNENNDNNSNNNHNHLNVEHNMKGNTTYHNSDGQNKTKNGHHSGITSKFTFIELFAGIGGFRLGMERLGGKCVFASEIDKLTRQNYKNNFSDTDRHLYGDIWEVSNDSIPAHDILVGGFPCQPFSKLGQQPGLEDERGQLFTQIVRILKHHQPKAFLLENVPGILSCDDGKALETILSALQNTGYEVSYELINSRNLTVQNRTRVYFVGFLKRSLTQLQEPPRLQTDIQSTTSKILNCHYDHLKENLDIIKDSSNAANKTHNENSADNTNIDNSTDSHHFQFPYIPDLKLTSELILQSEEEFQRECKGPNPSKADYNWAELRFTLTNRKTKLLNENKYWHPGKMAWGRTVISPLIGHYGKSIHRGESQLVPRPPPFNPRRFTPRECARIMGFPESFTFSNDPSKWYIYCMFGNAVCPPIICMLVGAMLEHMDFSRNDPKETSDGYVDDHSEFDTEAEADHCLNSHFQSTQLDWLNYSRLVALELALDVIGVNHPHREGIHKSLLDNLYDREDHFLSSSL